MLELLIVPLEYLTATSFLFRTQASWDASTMELFWSRLGGDSGEPVLWHMWGLNWNGAARLDL